MLRGFPKRAHELLQTLPPGTELTYRELGERLGLDESLIDTVAPRMASALNRGFFKRRRVGDGDPRMLISLPGDPAESAPELPPFAVAVWNDGQTYIRGLTTLDVETGAVTLTAEQSMEVLKVLRCAGGAPLFDRGAGDA
jgi:hypothetical protein